MYTEFMQNGTTKNSENYCDTIQILETRILRIKHIRTIFIFYCNNARSKK